MGQSLFDLVTSQLDDRTIAGIAGKIGASVDQTRTAVPTAAAALIGGLANQAGGGGAEALHGALERDHDGSVLDDLGSLLGNPDAFGGGGILGHVFGSRRPTVESGLGKTTGLDPGQMSQLLRMLAPIVMGMLGKAQRGRGLDPGGLADLLGGERSRIAERAPGGADLLGKLLDADGDGSVMDDLAKMGGGLLGGMFGKR